MIDPSTMSPPASPTAGPQPPTSRPSTDLSLDLTSLPPLVWPSPPSNTLLITNLNNPATFHPASLEKIRDLLSSPTPLNSFSPLRSLHRIIVSYGTIDAAVAARELLESPLALPLSSSLSSSSTNNDDHQQQQQHSSQQKPAADRIKIYFGNPTPILGQEDGDDHHHQHHLQPPAMGKLLFISPPPSPPCGWEIREEDPPNKETHAEDLQRALAGLGGGAAVGAAANAEGRRRRRFEDKEDGDGDGDTTGEGGAEEGGVGNKDGEEEEELDGFGKRRTEGTRTEDVRTRRSKSLTTTTMVYHPRHHGDREDLPAVMVEDTSGAAAGDEGLGEREGSDGDGEGEGKKIMAHTARPPVELMEK